MAIKTGIVGEDGREAVLREYLCDWPDCANVAQHLVGVGRDVGMACAICPEHHALMENRTRKSSAD